jgi:heptosyltransferase-2
MHVATAFQVPVVAIFGPTDWRTTSPYGARHAIVRQPVDCAPCLLRECPIDHRCMTGVSVEMVEEAAEQVADPSGSSRLSGSSGSNQINETNHINQIDQTNVLDGVTVFLDRDGTLNEDLGYLKSAAELRLMPGVGASLARLKAQGAKLVVVTNQSGIGRGLLTHKDVETVHARLQGLLEREEAGLDAVYFCPHHPNDGCRCRKPGTAMVERAVSELQLDLHRADFVGDRGHDIELGNIVGAKTILLPCKSTDERMRDAAGLARSKPNIMVHSMAEAVDWILKDAALKSRSEMASESSIKW